MIVKIFNIPDILKEMSFYLCVVLTLFFAFSLDYVEVLENGLARTPPMGWMSWGYYMCSTNCEKEPHKCLDEKLILSVADTFFNDGYLEAGYEYIIIDDCWSEMQRDPFGRLMPDAERFPNGMKYIADYIHDRGLKFGMYTNIAETTCMGYPGSKDHFALDALTLASWDVDYLKVDGCFVTESYLNEAYIKLGRQLKLAGRPMVYSCSWPYYLRFIHNKTENYKEVSKYCNLWRNYHDVQLKWASIMYIIYHYELNWDQIAPYHGPGGWSDPDMLIFGTDSLTESQSRVQLAVYSMLSAPLLLSCNMANIKPYEKKLLQNLDLIAIAQDPLGIMAKPYIESEWVTLWVKQHLPCKGNKVFSFTFALVNVGNTSYDTNIVLTQYKLNNTDGYTIRDVFSGVYTRNVSLNDSIKMSVPEEDVVMYTLFPL